MTTVTSNTRTSVLDGYHGEGPKWRLEHATSGQAVCQQAACKRAKSGFQKGEFRIGTNTLFDRGGENRWYIAWRHWACTTTHQIKGLKGVTKNDPTMAPGYDRLSSDAQEQVRLAFENECIVNKEFKGTNAELSGAARRYHGEYTNATGYKADIATRGTAACRNDDCPGGGAKIAKGELRLGISVPFDGEYESIVYKHWGCMSKFDVEQLQERYGRDSFDVPNLSDELQEVIMNTLESGSVVLLPKPGEPAPKSTPKRRVKKGVVLDENSVAAAAKKAKKQSTTLKGKKTVKQVAPGEDGAAEAPPSVPDEATKSKEVAPDDNSAVEAPEPQVVEDTDAPESKTKKKGKDRGRKRPSAEMDCESEPEYVPKKSKSRSRPMI